MTAAPDQPMSSITVLSRAPVDRTAPDLADRVVAARSAGPIQRIGLSTIARSLEVVASLPSSVRRLLCAQFVTQSSDVVASLALMQFVVFEAERGASRTALARFIFAAIAPALIAGPLAGRFADRIDRQRGLVLALRARAFVTLGAVLAPLLHSRPAGYAFIALAIGISRFQFTCRASLMPELVPPGMLARADATSMMTGMAAGVFGGIMGSRVAALPAVALVLASVGHVCAASVIGHRRFAASPRPRTEHNDHAEHAGSVSAAEGTWRSWRALITPATRFAIATTCAHRLFLGTASASFVLAADRRYGLNASGYAAAIGLLGVGSFLGTFTAPTVCARMDARRLAAFAFALAAIGFASAAQFANAPFAILSMVFAGFAAQNLRIASDVAVQATSDHRSVGRVYALYDALYSATFVVGVLTGLVLARPSHPGSMFAIAALAYAIAGSACALRRALCPRTVRC